MKLILQEYGGVIVAIICAIFCIGLLLGYKDDGAQKVSQTMTYDVYTGNETIDTLAGIKPPAIDINPDNVNAIGKVIPCSIVNEVNLYDYVSVTGYDKDNIGYTLNGLEKSASGIDVSGGGFYVSGITIYLGSGEKLTPSDVSGTIMPSQKGKWYVTYKAVDKNGMSSSRTFIFTCK